MTRAALIFALLCSDCASTSAAVYPKVASVSEPTAVTLAELLGLTSPTPSTCPANGLLHLGEIDTETAAKLVAELKACAGRPVVIEFDSPGGGIFAAQDMQKAIERHDKPVLCVVDGMAASAAFVTLQACTTRYATTRSILMAHEGSMGVKGQTVELENSAELLRVLNWGMAAYVAHRIGCTVEEFQARIANGREWYLTQADAIREHVIDGPAIDVDEVVRMVAP